MRNSQQNRKPDRKEITFETVNAPLSKWPRAIMKLRKSVFPSWFVTDFLPAPFRYRGWIISAKSGRKTIGFALCDSLEESTAIYLEEVAVHPSYQDRGVGTQLVSLCASLAKEQGYLAMWATPLAGEEDKGLWLQKRGLIPNDDGVETLLDEILLRAMFSISQG